MVDADLELSRVAFDQGGRSRRRLVARVQILLPKLLYRAEMLLPNEMAAAATTKMIPAAITPYPWR